MSFRYIAFTDLHVEARTLERCLEVLRRTRLACVEQKAKAVCIGDFWERRGTIQVRQLYAIQREFELWQQQGVDLVMIPGNHDQVTQDGLVHGVDVFSAFSNIHVATEPMFRFEERVVFLPWREDPTEQAEMFWALAGGQWTIFAHAEVQGATTNQAHVAPGRVSLVDIEKCARACYVGHYHKRQQLGDRTWYIGSPFEMNFGERDMPHGIALITGESITPQFADFDDMPKHVRMALHEIPMRAPQVRKQDIVEVLWDVATPQGALESALALLPAQDIRPRPTRALDEDSKSAPALSTMTLDVALAEYVRGEDVIPNMTEQALTERGLALLSEVSTKAIAPLGAKVEFVQVKATDFCALRGLVLLSLDKQGLLLLRGEQGVGKTSLADAITWCLFGVTTPRKAGGDAPSLSGDEVIHDDASTTSVELLLRVDGLPMSIERVKKRGKGAKVAITGGPSDGVRDQQELIERVLGLDGPLWRACVSLGQGAVGNFLTSTDKKRKDLLSSAYGLDVCEPAGKLAKSRLSRVTTRIDVIKRDVAKCEGAIAELRAQDYEAMAQRWESEHASTINGLLTEKASYAHALQQCEQGLVEEPKWVASKAQHDAHQLVLQDQLSKFPVAERISQLQTQIASCQVERSAQERELNGQRGHLQRAMQARQEGTGVVCPTCKRAFDQHAAEEHIEVLEKAIPGLSSILQTQDVRLSDLSQQLAALNAEHDAARAGTKQQLSDVQRALGQINQALNTFATLRTNQQNAQHQLQRVEASLAQQQALTNPWRAQQQEQAGRIEAYDQELAKLRAERYGLDLEEAAYDFWLRAFSAKGLPVLVLRSAMAELEVHVNRFLGDLTEGRIYAVLEMDGEDLRVLFREYNAFTKQLHDRRYEQLSGGERRSAELSFSPFALGELIFSRTGSRVGLLLIDELTTHLGARQKALAVQLLRVVGRETVVVIDHDVSVQGEFDRILELRATPEGSVLAAV